MYVQHHSPTVIKSMFLEAIILVYIICKEILVLKCMSIGYSYLLDQIVVYNFILLPLVSI